VTAPMTANIINRRDLDFLLFEWLKVEEVLARRLSDVCASMPADHF
jgi:hypothetical protein